MIPPGRLSRHPSHTSLILVTQVYFEAGEARGRCSGPAIRYGTAARGTALVQRLGEALWCSGPRIRYGAAARGTAWCSDTSYGAAA